MIDYKLAKELKTAGFPQEHIELYCLDCKKCKIIKCFDNEHKSEAISYPTLSELIDACGDGFKILMKVYNNGTDLIWIAGKGDRKTNGEGKTPEIAVANLWKKLNEKKKNVNNS